MQDWRGLRVFSITLETRLFRILSPVRLPVPPPRRNLSFTCASLTHTKYSRPRCDFAIYVRLRVLSQNGPCSPRGNRLLTESGPLNFRELLSGR
jgi:hypothetical protein